MIEGSVNADLKAVVRLLVGGRARPLRDIEAVIDTGYDGLLILPPALVDELRLPFVTVGHATFANGSETTFAVYDATVVWDGQPRHVLVDAPGGPPLVGMALLEGHHLHVEVSNGGRVLIEAA